MNRNSPERNLPIMEKQMRDNRTRQAAIDAQLKQNGYDPENPAKAFIAGVSDKIGLGDVPGSAAYDKGQFDSLTEEKNKLATELQQMGDEMRKTTQGLEIENRHIDQDR